MSLRLLIDEDSQAKLLVNLLRKAGHDVVTINELELSGSDDTVVLDCARKQERVLLTQNCQDFETLHQLNSIHPGILAIYQDNYSSKNMLLKDIVKAIANLEAANIPLINQFISLNHWNY
ncbi:MAG: DUF5615 family PIN-like protein [Hydrococcus sp. SU_1_0]|nr:DUF5615 family PIN-like protein [Hydrococcus sp. SU_1_0]NJO98931.1 DUF5615 family PIN-like protein [Pleurocapsa sp. CRU_1_2]